MDSVNTSGQRYAGNTVGDGKAVTLLASATYTAAEANAVKAIVTGLEFYKQAQIALILTDAKAAVGDTLDVFIDTSPDSGTTWLNVIHFTQILGNGADALSFVATLDPGASPGTSVIATTSDANAATVRPTMFCDRLRVRHTLVDGGAHGQSFTYSVKGFFKG